MATISLFSHVVRKENMTCKEIYGLKAIGHWVGVFLNSSSFPIKMLKIKPDPNFFNMLNDIRKVLILIFQIALNRFFADTL